MEKAAHRAWAPCRPDRMARGQVWQRCHLACALRGELQGWAEAVQLLMMGDGWRLPPLLLGSQAPSEAGAGAKLRQGPGAGRCGPGGPSRQVCLLQLGMTGVELD